MTINEILELSYSKENIQQIDKYLSKTDKNDLNYLKAWCHKQILLANTRLNNSLKEVYAYVSYFNTLDDEAVVILCNTIMALTLKAKRLDQYEKYMLIKADRIKAKDSYTIYYDKYVYYKALKNYSEAVKQLYNYLDNDLLEVDRFKALNDLLNLSYEIKNYDLFFRTSKSISEIYEKSLGYSGQNQFNLLVIEMYYDAGNLNKAYDLGKKYLEVTDLTKEETLKAATILLKILISRNDLRQASIIESDYADLVEEANQVTLEFAQTALELYKLTNHKLSISHYENKIEEIKTKLAENKPKNKKELYIIPEVATEEKLNNPEIRVVPQEKKEIINEYVVAENNEVIRTLAKMLSRTVRLRDALRNLGILLEEKYQIIKFNLIYEAKNYYLHTYKSEKLYDRTYKDIPVSSISEALKEEKMVIIPKELLNQKIDIFTNQPYTENDFVFSFPLTDEANSLGTIEFVATNDILAIPGNYDFFQNLISILSLRIAFTRKIKLMEAENALVNYVWHNFYFGVKKIINQQVELDGNASQIYRLTRDVGLQEFLSNMASKDVTGYRDLLTNLKINPTNNKIYEYEYRKDGLVRNIKEIFYAYPSESEIIIVSIVIDQTNSKEAETKLLNKAYYDEISGLFNKNKLNQQLNEIQNKRYSLAIFGFEELKDYKDLYGYSFYIDFVRLLKENIGIFFKNYFNIFAYIIDENHFALVLLDINDKRKEETLLKKFISFLENAFIDLKYSVHPNFKIGVYLHAKEEKKTIDLIYDYAYNAYLDSCDRGGISYYSYQNYKERFKAKEKAVLLQENILNNQIKVAYTQLIDVVNQEVFGYVIKLQLPNLNIYEDEIKTILIKQQKYRLYQKYKLTALCKELVLFYSEVGAYIEVLVEFENDVIDDYFSEFVLTQLSFFKLPTDILTIVVDHYSPNLTELTKHNIKIITRDFYDIINQKTNNIWLDLNKLNKAKLAEINQLIGILKATIYLANVDDKKDLNMIKEANISYIYGQVYSKSYSISELILEMKE